MSVDGRYRCSTCLTFAVVATLHREMRGLLPKSGVIAGGALQPFGLHSGLLATRLVQVGLRPVPQQIAARGRLRAAAGSPVGSVACRWRRAVRLPVARPDGSRSPAGVACRSRCALPAVPSPVPVVVMVRVVGDDVMPPVIGRLSAP